MSGAKEVATTAIDNIENLIAEMLDGDYADNEVSLGRLLCGKEEIQVRLSITRNKADFIFDEFEDLTDA